MNTKKIKAMLRLFRPELPLAAGICVVTGQFLAAGRLPAQWVGILGFLSVFALSSTALILNDYFDYEVDLVNHPNRPLPSGAVSKGEVIGLSILTTLVGLAAAAMLGLDVLLVSIPIWLIGVLYNWRFKKTGLPGNLMVCASVAATFIFGAVTVNDPWNGNVWAFSLMAFFIDLGEEIAGDAMDMEGDRKINSQSIALRKGKRFALRVTVVMWSMAILISLVPVILGWMGTFYLVSVLFIAVVLITSSVRLLNSQTPKAGRRAMRVAYLGATLAILAFVVGQFFG